MGVPKFEGYFPSIEDMDSDQRDFYRKVEISLSAGDYIDVEGNIGYVFVYLYNLVGKWDNEGFEQLSEFLTRLSELYKHESKLSDYCLFWAHDCLLGLERYEEYLNITEPKQAFGTSTHHSNLRLNISSFLGEEPNHIDVLLMAGGRKTKFIENNEALYRTKVKDVFEDYSTKHGGWFALFQSWGASGGGYEHTLFSGAPLWEKPSLSFKLKAFYSAYDKLSVIKQLSKDAENLAREEMGVPKIGEGWVSETQLFKKLQHEFSSSLVIQHGQPTWLGRQHYDIWFPHWKVAVEYHGKQHFEPVEFFGGEEAFRKTVERDKRKISLSKRHGVKLFVVTEDDDISELIHKIRIHMSSRKVGAPKA